MFIYKQWDEFCRNLQDRDIKGITADEALKGCTKRFLILKHDVETNPEKALRMAQIESDYGHKGSYYVQGYILKKEKNIDILKKIQELGHEVTYHHDVMDSSKGDKVKAQAEFEEYRRLFEENGFKIRTVCQHGNPVVKREGYTSNRDFFRDEKIADKYGGITEMMVNFRERLEMDFRYVSDAGYGWKIIADPETNDIIKSDHKDVKLENLSEVAELTKENLIVSTHPHRWHENEMRAKGADAVFKGIKGTARTLMKVKVLKRIMEKFYFLAKKI